MKEINIPGFGAERSLEGRRKTYPAVFSANEPDQITPQMTAQCVADAIGYLGRCISGGSGTGSCGYLFRVDMFYCRYS